MRAAAVGLSHAESRPLGRAPRRDGLPVTGSHQGSDHCGFHTTSQRC